MNKNKQFFSLLNDMYSHVMKRQDKENYYYITFALSIFLFHIYTAHTDTHTLTHFAKVICAPIVICCKQFKQDKFRIFNQPKIILLY